MPERVWVAFSGHQDNAVYWCYPAPELTGDEGWLPRTEYVRADLLQAAEAEARRYKAALERIEHGCQHLNITAADQQYAMGLDDGHRCASEMARKALLPGGDQKS